MGADEGGEDDDIVAVVAAGGIERPAACDQAQGTVVEVAVDEFGREVVLRVLVYRLDREDRHHAVEPSDQDLVAWEEVCEVKKH